MAKVVPVMSAAIIALIAGRPLAAESEQPVHTLATTGIEVVLEHGLSARVVNRLTGQTLIALQAAAGAGEVALFGPGRRSVGEATVQERASAGEIVTRYEFADGSAWLLRWSAEACGDVVVRASARSRFPVGQLRFALSGCDICGMKLVTITNFGVGLERRAPWNDPPDDSARDEYLPQYVQPLVALFEGQGGGFFVEGRCLEAGPANLIAHGRGHTADLTFIRGFPCPTRTPAMYEIRIRAYSGRWQQAADPYVAWMEHGLGMVPLERKQPAWVRGIRAQTYVDPRGWVKGEGIAKLERMAKELDPRKTLLGKISEYRPIPEFGFDVGYPDYTPTEESRRFIRRARELGFHVSVHFNTAGIDMRFKELIERFRPGLQQTGWSELGEPVYWGPRFANAYGQVNFAYCSTAYKPWREYLIAQMREVVDAGADIIYLDESHTPAGAFRVGDVSAVQGVMALEREILEAYPHVAIQTEQFNPMNARHAAFALTSMQLGHPLSGYLFHRFVKVCCWYGMYQLSDEAELDGWERWGFLVPGAESDPAWLDIARAFQRYDLEPDPARELGDHEFSTFRGAGGVAAAFAKQDGWRGLVVRHADGSEEWFGKRPIAAP